VHAARFGVALVGLFAFHIPVGLITLHRHLFGVLLSGSGGNWVEFNRPSALRCSVAVDELQHVKPRRFKRKLVGA
jgi:hypothetical protein